MLRRIRRKEAKKDYELEADQSRIKKDVEECFRKIINNRPHLKVEPIIDGIAASFILIKIKIL